jgi:hypothetical protein
MSLAQCRCAYRSRRAPGSISSEKLSALEGKGLTPGAAA